jgi:hypothetical protein
MIVKYCLTVLLPGIAGIAYLNAFLRWANPDNEIETV